MSGRPPDPGKDYQDNVLAPWDAFFERVKGIRYVYLILFNGA
jgi:hypothetical protein